MKRTKKTLLLFGSISVISLIIAIVLFTKTGQQTVLTTIAQVMNEKSEDHPSIQMQWLKIPTPTPSPTPAPTQTPPPGSSAATGGGNTDVVELARKQIGKMYLWGSPSRNWASDGADPKNFDCSGLVGWAWYTASGGKVKMAGQTSADWGSPPAGFQKFTAGDIDKIQPGDLVYFTGSHIHHVGMYSGSSCGAAHCFIDAPQSGKPVRESSLDVRNASKDPMVGFLRPTSK